MWGRFFRALWVWFWLFVLTEISIYPALADASPQASRHALIIANSNYDNVTWSRLPNTLNDAKLVKAALSSSGFGDVELDVDLPAVGMRRVVQRFYEKAKLSSNNEIYLIYYAGHGIQINGVNYLVPIGAGDPRNLGKTITEEVERTLARDMVVANDLLFDRPQIATDEPNPTGGERGLERSRVLRIANIIVLDACRENPFQRSRGSVTRGLAEIQGGRNSLIAFSAAAGAVADDGPPSESSPYAKVFAHNVQQSGIPLELLFSAIKYDLLAATHGSQRAEYRNNLDEQYCLSTCKETALLTPARSRIAPAQVNCRFCLHMIPVDTPTGKFWASANPISIGLWKKCVENLRCNAIKSDLDSYSDNAPAIFVSWKDSMTFVEWLTDSTGHEYLLPTSAQWDRLHTKEEPPHSYSHKDLVGGMALPGDGEHIAALGLIAEWTSTCDGSSENQVCNSYVVRGKSWRNDPGAAADRDVFPLNAKGDAIGFRVITEKEPANE